MKLSTIDPQILAGISECILELGGDPKAVFANAAPSLALRSKPFNAVPVDYFLALLNEAAQETSAPYFGLFFGTRFRRRNLGLLQHLFTYNETLLNSIEGFEKYFSALQTNSHYALNTDGNYALIEYRAPNANVAFNAQDAEFSLMLHCRFLRFSLGEKWVPDHLEFQHRQISSASDYFRFLGCDTAFGKPMNRIVFHRKHLQSFNANSDPTMAILIKRALEEEISRLRKPFDPVQLVRNAISDCIALNKSPNAQIVAQMLNVSARQLSTMLKKEGASFRILLLDERVKVAKRLLLRSSMSVGEISDHLRYSELSAFSRQFKRLTGLSPRTFRSTATAECGL